ncbi:MAG: hypothetical protein HGB36_11990 [Chlorobiaceae bacterium]|nr:hypothetical protein [Chlorobiaceae bacterium]
MFTALFTARKADSLRINRLQTKNQFHSFICTDQPFSGILSRVFIITAKRWYHRHEGARARVSAFLLSNHIGPNGNTPLHGKRKQLAAPSEIGLETIPEAGQLPPSLEGTVLRNACFRKGKRPVIHENRCHHSFWRKKRAARPVISFWRGKRAVSNGRGRGTSIDLFRSPVAALVPMNRNRNPQLPFVHPGFGVYPDLVGTLCALHSYFSRQ